MKHSKKCQIDDLALDPRNIETFKDCGYIPYCPKIARHSMVLYYHGIGGRNNKHVIRVCDEHFGMMKNYWNQDLLGLDADTVESAEKDQRTIVRFRPNRL